jgi:hypothetical protein
MRFTPFFTETAILQPDTGVQPRPPPLKPSGGRVFGTHPVACRVQQASQLLAQHHEALEVSKLAFKTRGALIYPLAGQSKSGV